MKEENKKRKILFKDLSWGLKAPIVVGWIVIVVFGIGVLMGFAGL